MVTSAGTHTGSPSIIVSGYIGGVVYNGNDPDSFYTISGKTITSQDQYRFILYGVRY